MKGGQPASVAAWGGRSVRRAHASAIRIPQHVGSMGNCPRNGVAVLAGNDQQLRSGGFGLGSLLQSKGLDSLLTQHELLHLTAAG